MNVVEIENLQKTYAGKQPVRALEGVSLSIEQGAIVGLLGPNGAGKSTLVKILSTIAAPTAGRACVMGFDVAAQPLEARRRMAVVLQQTAAETLLTVRDNLLIYAYLHGLSRKEAEKRMRAVAEEFELSDKLGKTAMDLSLGTKRRIQVAKIFMLDAPLIILDEATTGMDPLMKRNVMDRLRLEARKGRTVLLTTQVLSEAEQLCDNIMIIHQGKMLASGTLPQLRRLSARFFRVSLTMERNGPEVDSLLNALHPQEFRWDGLKADLLFEGEQTSLLNRLAEVSKAVPIHQFEVRGPDLEEIFVSLLKES